ncbi:diphthine synthase [Candidatus Hecatella orcuttiae]|uniref:diphthine synthase n=1 Tax=Candidatus Hecatella orcuttiae TaxID=1935119 RepID=UPI002867E2B9|nr:diphthine synthase [Candidatus Hecatella orcuttiae]
MGKLTFIGLGLHDEKSLSLLGLEKAKAADRVYAEFYTNLMPKLSIKALENLLAKPVTVLSRGDLEERAEEGILRQASEGEVALLVPGDPLVATTHIDLRLRAERAGIETEVLNGVSIYSAAPAAAGLQVYKFGKTVTVPFPTPFYKPETPYEVVVENSRRGLHTLVLLDVDSEKGRCMTVREGLEYLLEVEEKRKEGAVTPRRLAVGLAGLGSLKPEVKGNRVERLLETVFEELPQCIIFPGKLHFMEAEALKVFAGTPEEAFR